MASILYIPVSIADCFIVKLNRNGHLSWQTIMDMQGMPLQTALTIFLREKYMISTKVF